MSNFESSVKALVDIAMMFFTEDVTVMHPDRVLNLKNVIEKFLIRSLSFEMACELTSALVGNTEPLEKLKVIIETSGDPIPVPDETLEPNGVLSHKMLLWSLDEMPIPPLMVRGDLPRHQ
jgi:hypothetical protein